MRKAIMSLYDIEFDKTKGGRINEIWTLGYNS
jgi:hypothetical protein